MRPSGMGLAARRLLAPVRASDASPRTVSFRARAVASRGFPSRRRDAHIASAAASATAGNGDGEKCFVTTPIYYVNDQPHIGHVYTSTVADAYARYRRARGEDVFFLTGTDEHGLKVEQSADKRGIEPRALADENSKKFRDVMTTYDISFDDFIRTCLLYTSPSPRDS